MHPGAVSIGEPREGTVEPPEKALAFAVVGLEHERCERRGEGKRDEARQRDRDGDGDRELLVELAGGAAQYRGRQEHRAEHEHDRDHRPADLVHRLERRLACRDAKLGHLVLDGLDHHDGIVHHDTDRDHQAEERQQVDRETEDAHPDEGADEGDKYRDGRDYGGAEAL